MEYTALYVICGYLVLLLALGVFVASVPLGVFWAVFWAWIVPRLVIYLAHAYYICFFPHSVENGGYRILRIRVDNPLRGGLTFNQLLHGIHHHRIEYAEVQALPQPTSGETKDGDTDRQSSRKASRQGGNRPDEGRSHLKRLGLS